MGLFGLFGNKKKKNPQPGTNTAGEQQTQQPVQSVQQQQVMQSLPKPTKVQTHNKDDPDQWIYDSILQYLVSPLWKVPIYSFIDENCIVFDDEEENKFEYTEIHAKFKKMIEDMLSNLLTDLGVNEEQFLIVVNKGLAIPQQKKVFEQLLIADNFLVFKKLMLKRNKELELEAMRQLDEQSGQVEEQSTEASVRNPDIQKLQLEKEQAEIEEAIARSLAAEQERAKLAEIEDEELREVLRQSQLEYEKQQARERAERLKEEEAVNRIKAEQLAEEEARKKAEAKKLEEAAAQQKPQETTQKETTEASPEKKEIEVTKSQNLSSLKDLPPVQGKKPMGKLEPIADSGLEESKSRLPELTTSQWKSSLPPIGRKNYDNFTNEELLKEKEQISKKLETINSAPKQEISQESLEERKKRLQAQRELILKKKQQERENELKKYEQEQKTGHVSNPSGGDPLEVGLSTSTSNTSTIDSKEAEKRKAIYSQLKNI